MGLTAKQERYAQERANGQSQYQSYLTAYPASQKWKRNAVDTQASILESNSKIVERIAELKTPAEDLLESNRKSLIETAVKLADGTLPASQARKVNATVLNKLLDKLLATKTENKTDLTLGESLIDLIKARRSK